MVFIPCQRGRLSRRSRSFSRLSEWVLLVAFGLVLARMRQIALGLHTLRRRTASTSKNSLKLPRKIMEFLLESAVILTIGDKFSGRWRIARKLMMSLFGGFQLRRNKTIFQISKIIIKSADGDSLTWNITIREKNVTRILKLVTSLDLWNLNYSIKF